MKHILSIFALCLLGCHTAAAQTTVTIPATTTDGQAYYALYSAPVALDFSATEGLEAYVCTRLQMGILYDEQTVTLTRVEAVPANTGLLLRATEARQYSLKEATASVKAPRRNMLVAVSERTDVADIFQDDGWEIYSPATLATNADGQPGFAVVACSSDYKKNDEGVYVKIYHHGEVFLEAGTAYLGVSELMGTGTVATMKLLAEPEPVPVAGDISEAKNICDRATENGELLLTLNNARITYATPGSASSDELVIIEDESGALRLRQSGLGAQLKAGNTLNGTLSLSIAFSDIANELIADETTNTDELTIGEGEAPEPQLITEDNVEEYIYNYDWRFVRFNGVTYIAGEEPELDVEMLGDRVKLFDICGVKLEPLADGTKIDAVGFLYVLMGNNYFQPLHFIVDGQVVGVTAPQAKSVAAPATVYDLYGRPVATPRKGLYISQGRKLIVK